mgnify:CR=1 FL=1
MLDLILEQLLSTLGAPWFAAVAGRKKKPVKKTVKKKAPKVSIPKSARAKKVIPPVRRKPATVVKRNEKPARDIKPVAREHAQPVPPPARVKPAENESLPKPMAPTGRAILLSPENEKFAESLHPTFRWLSVGGATRYEVAWSEEPNLAQSHSVVSIATEAAVPVEKPLRLGVAYYWHVRGGNEGGWGPWSATVSFYVLDEAT